MTHLSSNHPTFEVSYILVKFCQPYKAVDKRLFASEYDWSVIFVWSSKPSSLRR